MAATRRARPRVLSENVFPDGVQEGGPLGNSLSLISHLSGGQAISGSPSPRKCDGAFTPARPARAPGEAAEGLRTPSSPLLSPPSSGFLSSANRVFPPRNQQYARWLLCGQYESKGSQLTLMRALAFICMGKSLVGCSPKTAKCKEVSLFNLAGDDTPTCLSCHVTPHETMAPKVPYPTSGDAGSYPLRAGTPTSAQLPPKGNDPGSTI